MWHKVTFDVVIIDKSLWFRLEWKQQEQKRTTKQNQAKKKWQNHNESQFLHWRRCANIMHQKTDKYTFTPAAPVRWLINSGPSRWRNTCCTASCSSMLNPSCEYNAHSLFKVFFIIQLLKKIYIANILIIYKQSKQKNSALYWSYKGNFELDKAGKVKQS